MRPRRIAALTLPIAAAALIFPAMRNVGAGEESNPSGYTVLVPIRSGSLTVFPVVASKTFATSQFLTLDEGFRSGEVVVTEYGNVSGLVRRPQTPVVRQEQAEVNRLVLINNSKRPLLLLAGEIVTGGKQDRVIGKDRIVPAESEPIDLSVFCVEPGRWVASSNQFGASGTTYAAGSGQGVGVSGSAAGTMMAQPSVRSKAMAEKDQSQVWAEVRKQQSAMSAEVMEAAPASSPLPPTTSYARVMENQTVKQKVDEVAKPVEENYQSLIVTLRDRKAVGVVVAVNGRIIWSDIFASTELLEKYWPKLVRSYASEAVVQRVTNGDATLAQAQAYLADMQGRKETIENEPGIYRQSEVRGDGFRVFALMSLLPKTGFEVHIAKMAD
jgi:hypothetical protein